LDRKKPKIDHRKIRGIETYSYGRIKEFCSIEVEPIIKMLPDKKLEESFRQSLKNI
jgi:hypothetical protein